MIRALLWDHDGVLVDTEELYLRATQETLASIGIELTREEHRRSTLVESRGAWHLARARGVAEDEVARLRAQRDARYTALLSQGNLVLPGVLELLRELHGQLRMAIVTSSKRAHFDVIHRGGELPAFFELVLAREDYENAKPDPEPYRLALTRLGLSAAEALVIEDSERGLRAAKAAGLACWVVPSALAQGSRFEAADARFESFAGLADALRDLTARSR